MRSIGQIFVLMILLMSMGTLPLARLGAQTEQANATDGDFNFEEFFKSLLEEIEQQQPAEDQVTSPPRALTEKEEIAPQAVAKDRKTNFLTPLAIPKETEREERETKKIKIKLPQAKREAFAYYATALSQHLHAVAQTIRAGALGIVATEELLPFIKVAELIISRIKLIASKQVYMRSFYAAAHDAVRKNIITHVEKMQSIASSMQSIGEQYEEALELGGELQKKVSAKRRSLNKEIQENITQLNELAERLEKVLKYPEAIKAIEEKKKQQEEMVHRSESQRRAGYRGSAWRPGYGGRDYGGGYRGRERGEGGRPYSYGSGRYPSYDRYRRDHGDDFDRELPEAEPSKGGAADIDKEKKAKSEFTDVFARMEYLLDGDLSEFTQQLLALQNDQGFFDPRIPDILYDNRFKEIIDVMNEVRKSLPLMPTKKGRGAKIKKTMIKTASQESDGKEKRRDLTEAETKLRDRYLAFVKGCIIPATKLQHIIISKGHALLDSADQLPFLPYALFSGRDRSERIEEQAVSTAVQQVLPLVKSFYDLVASRHAPELKTAHKQFITRAQAEETITTQQLSQTLVKAAESIENFIDDMSFLEGLRDAGKSLADGTDNWKDPKTIKTWHKDAALLQEEAAEGAANEDEVKIRDIIPVVRSLMAARALTERTTLADDVDGSDTENHLEPLQEAMDALKLPFSGSANLCAFFAQALNDVVNDCWHAVIDRAAVSSHHRATEITAQHLDERREMVRKFITDVFKKKANDLATQLDPSLESAKTLIENYDKIETACETLTKNITEQRAKAPAAKQAVWRKSQTAADTLVKTLKNLAEDRERLEQAADETQNIHKQINGVDNERWVVGQLKNAWKITTEDEPIKKAPAAQTWVPFIKSLFD